MILVDADFERGRSLEQKKEGTPLAEFSGGLKRGHHQFGETQLGSSHFGQLPALRQSERTERIGPFAHSFSTSKSAPILGTHPAQSCLPGSLPKQHQCHVAISNEDFHLGVAQN